MPTLSSKGIRRIGTCSCSFDCTRSLNSRPCTFYKDGYKWVYEMLHFSDAKDTSYSTKIYENLSHTHVSAHQ